LACSYVHEEKAALGAGFDTSAIDGEESESQILCSPGALLDARGGYAERTRLAQLEHRVRTLEEWAETLSIVFLQNIGTMMDLWHMTFLE
jgi:hypothetical protein